MAWPWTAQNSLVSRLLFLLLLPLFLLLMGLPLGQDHGQIGVHANGYHTIPLSRRRGRSHCSVTNLGRVVHCRLDRWTVNLRAFPWPRTRVKHLHIDILQRNSVLTAAHLAGFSSLRVLIVRGHCWDSYDGSSETRVSPYMRVCRSLRGLVDIRRGAFSGTPLLERLYLHAHPLVWLNNLEPLRRLRHLHLKQAFALRRISPSSLVNSLEQLTILQNNVSHIGADLFKHLYHLRTLSWTTIAPVLALRSYAFANLPNLSSIRLGCFSHCFVNDITFSRYTFFNLRSLRSVSLRNLLDVVLEDAPICYLPGVSIQRFHFVSSNPSILKFCPDFWRCVRCGQDPLNSPQSVVFHNLWLTGSPPTITRRLSSILPPVDFIRKLNVSSFYNDGTSFTDISDELSRFPLLRHLRLHSPRPSHQMSSHDSTVRLVNNPLAYLPYPHRLLEARFAIQVCDCFVTEMIVWSRRYLSNTHDSSASDILKISCGNMRCSCIPMTILDQPTAEPSKWMHLDAVMAKLRPYCTPIPGFVFREIPPKLCRPEPRCTKYSTAVKSGRENATVGERPEILMDARSLAVHTNRFCITLMSFSLTVSLFHFYFSYQYDR